MRKRCNSKFQAEKELHLQRKMTKKPHQQRLPLASQQLEEKAALVS